MHPSEEELEMYVLERLLPEQVSTVESHLAACSACAGKLPDLAGFALQLQTLSRKPLAAKGERRRDHRIPTEEPAWMRVLSPFSRDAFEIRVLNVSRNGLRASVPPPIPVGGRRAGSLQAVHYPRGVCVQKPLSSESSYFCEASTHETSR